MATQIIAFILITGFSWALLADDEYLIRPRQQSMNALSARASIPTKLRRLNESQADQLRSSGLLVEKNIQLHLVPSQSERAEVTDIHWPAAAMEVPAAHGLTNSKGEGQTICIVDTGIDLAHPMFANSNIETFNTINDTISAYDDQGHGTFVASLALGKSNPSAMAPESKLYAVKALNAEGSGTLADVTEAIDYCASQKAEVINLSLGTSIDSEILHESVRQAALAGSTLVAAVSNSGDDDVGFPAGYQEVIAVSSVDRNLNPATFSGSGPEVDIAAPGVQIWGAMPENKYETLSGNSMATAFVSGAVAMMKSRGAKGLVGFDLGLPSEIQGSGLINARLTAENLRPIRTLTSTQHK